jgi:hypothetical protein
MILQVQKVVISAPRRLQEGEEGGAELQAFRRKAASEAYALGKTV